MFSLFRSESWDERERRVQLHRSGLVVGKAAVLCRFHTALRKRANMRIGGLMWRDSVTGNMDQPLLHPVLSEHRKTELLRPARSGKRTAAVAEPSRSACQFAWSRGLLVRMPLPQSRAA